MLDAYDELNDKELKLNEIFQLNKQSNVKILMTSREKHQSLPEINQVLSFQGNSEPPIYPLITYICGFDKK